MTYTETMLDKVLGGEEIERTEVSLLSEQPQPELTAAADRIRREMAGNGFELCTIINAKSGRCSEDCKYCAQSCRYDTKAEEYPLLSAEEALAGAVHSQKQGVLRYSLVTSGKRLTEGEVEQVCEIYRRLAGRCSISLCASHGLLKEPQLVRLREAGVTRYHNNLETSRRYFPKICTTHTYQDKLDTIRAAQRAGLSVCSGGIIGLGETMQDRLDMAFELRELGITSVPVNVLNPIAGTPLAGSPRLAQSEIVKTVALFRFILPKAAIRLAGGRSLLQDAGEAAFCSGANAAISGDMLTTGGYTVADDMRRAGRLGLEVKLL